MHENFKYHLKEEEKKADLGLLVYLTSFWNKEASNIVAKHQFFFTTKAWNKSYFSIIAKTRAEIALQYISELTILYSSCDHKIVFLKVCITVENYILYTLFIILSKK